MFQYAFLKTISKKGENIFVFGFNELKEVFYFEKKDRTINNFNLSNRLIHWIVQPFLIFLVRKKIINYINVKEIILSQDYKYESSVIKKQMGVFSSFTYVESNYFQSEEFFDKKCILNLKIKNFFKEHGKRILSQVPKKTYMVFIHLRRGDYVNFEIFGKTTLLPKKYFVKQINWFLENKKKPFFIFLSDDPVYVKKEFKYLESKLILEGNHFGVDFYIMTKCNGAVLSASSFSWWGSYLMKNRDKVFAPKYWLGFKSKIDFPSNTVPSYAEAIEI